MLEKATFGAGCFWCVEDSFMKLNGVKETVVGYCGGTMNNPTYKDVCTGNTGHAEVVQVEFNPEEISYETLLDEFFGIHDPTQVDRQGPDVGSQYRSAIFYHSPEQEQKANAFIQQLQESGRFQSQIATQVVPAAEFFKAEEYHQKYNQKLRQS